MGRKSLHSRYGPLPRLGQGKQPCKRKNDEQRDQVNHDLHAGRLVSVGCITNTSGYDFRKGQHLQLKNFSDRRLCCEDQHDSNN
jgi:hypothetical protein